MGIDRAVAEIYDALGDPRAVLAHEAADRAEAAERDDADTEGRLAYLEAVEAAMGKVPAAPESVKHTDDCWQRHAACLVTYLEALAEG
jgi:hypothetical protein